ncbi:23S rRNA (pseudouridine(1915)-N(3))-methyltransferase RlmH [soil metagenome]
MRIHVGAVGRLKAGPERKLADAYLERAATLGRSAGISAVAIAEIAESRAATAALRMADEAARLRAGLAGEAVTVALDSGGRDITSEEFAVLVGRWRDGGTGTLAFFIGGPDGLAPDIKATAAYSLAFGRMTWPHRLARIMLLEQVYRSVTILVNHPYHRM